MNIANPVSSSITSVSFSALQSSDIRGISVKQVTNPVLFDQMGQPTPGGLYDAAFGPRGRSDICSTCRLTSFDCPGHFGHVELPMPVFHPLYITQAYQLLRGTCTFCHHFLLGQERIQRYVCKLSLLEHGLVAEAAGIDDFQVQKKASAPKKHTGPVTLSDEDEGEDTGLRDGSDDQTYQQKIQEWTRLSLNKSKTTRNEYKNSPIAFDERRRLIKSFFKEIQKKSCGTCGAHVHRLKKEGHTKILEYSLVSKSKAYNRARQLRKPNVLKEDATVKAESDEDEEIDDDADSDRMSVDGEDSDARQQREDETLANYRTRQTERIITPQEVRAHVRRLFKTEQEIVNLLYGAHGPMENFKSKKSANADMFFMDVVAVVPTRFRPASTMGDKVFENPQNTLLNNILRQTIVVRDLNVRLITASDPNTMEVDENGKPKEDKKVIKTKLMESLIGLQVAVNSMMDNTKNPMITKAGKEPPAGVKQMLEKKEGLFRQNMMGKRVNYAARSVISPDVNIETNEIGVPPVFARKLTFPEPVTPHNIRQLQQAVINGPNVHPGASFIQLEDGNLISLDNKTLDERTAEANKLLAPESRVHSHNRADRPEFGIPYTATPQINRKVYRHIQDGDIVILNRQPTLHKPSMMCHRVKVLKGEKTIRMHYANCNSYNADFDGDEMNMHFPQSLIAQAEARLLANTDSQYLVPTSGNPLRGLIQDHVVAGVWLTNKDTWFTREEYYQLIYGALRPENNYTGNGMVITVPPAIMKPRMLWSGKQVITTLLENIKPAEAHGITFTCKGKIPGQMWGIHKEEETMNVFEGEHITGILDKAQIGASAYGLVHTVHELYGPESAGKLLSILSRLLTKYLQSRAFTCRMDDLILTPKGDAARRSVLETVNERGVEAALEYVGLKDADRTRVETERDMRARLEEVLREDNKLAGLDATVSGETAQVSTKIIKTCLPEGLTNPFPHNHMQTMTVSGAKGSNVNASQISCLLGQQQLEGRRVPVMVSGKTLPSFKAFETAPRAGGFVACRFLTGLRPQEYYFHCMAGREGLIDTAVKTSRSGYLQRCLIKHLEGLRVHYDHTVRNSDNSILQFQYGEDSLDVTKQKHLLKFEFAARNTRTLVQRFQPKTLVESVSEIDESLMKKTLKHPDKHPPLLSMYSPSTHIGAVSEYYQAEVEKYISKNPEFLLRTKKKHRVDWPSYIKDDDLIRLEFFRSLMWARYMRSLVDPGEAVGLMASQGVGEPSTQMTLNTFHFAGHGAANVTLGIPRLREIVMTASQKIMTPTMTLPIKEEVSQDDLETLCKKVTRLTLAEVLDSVQVHESLSGKQADGDNLRKKLYTVRLQFFPQEDYKTEYSVSPEQVLLSIQRAFVPALDRAILKEIKQNDKEANTSISDIGQARSNISLAAAAREDEENTPEDEGAISRDVGEEIDMDADDARRARQNKDDSDDEQEEVSDDDDAKLEAAFKDSDSDQDLEESDDDSDNEEKALMERLKTTERAIAAKSRYIERARFDKVNGEWCELDLEFNSKSFKLLLVGIVESVCCSSVIHEISDIKRCFVAKAAKSADAGTPQRRAMTEGVNLQAAWNFGYKTVDLNKLSTNDVGAVLRTYGVEAARKCIISEISSVFNTYGIAVDYRHLTIIADYMTCEGGYKPFNRTGLSNNTSPFLKASYETTAAFVSEAALYGDFDDLGTPSAKIVLGRTPASGTGTGFEICAAQVV